VLQDDSAGFVTIHMWHQVKSSQVAFNAM